MGDTAFWAVVVAALAVVVNAVVSIFLHFRRVKFEEALATKKLDYDEALAKRKLRLERRARNRNRKGIPKESEV
jgi:hypothetical protein